MGKFTLFCVTSAHTATIEYPNDGDQIIHSVDIHNLSVYKKIANLVFPQIKNLISKNHTVKPSLKETLEEPVRNKYIKIRINILYGCKK